MVIVQRIETIWTKATRDASGREARARLPKGYSLPENVVRSGFRCARHLVRRAEPDFVPLTEVECGDALSTGRSTGGGASSSVRLRIVEDALEVAFLATDCGMPHRNRRTLRLHPNQWARVRYNGRFVSTSTSRGDHAHYEEKVINVAFRVVPSATMFLAEPSVTMEVMADLY